MKGNKFMYDFRLENLIENGKYLEGTLCEGADWVELDQNWIQ
jgi:hypothetical protein